MPSGNSSPRLLALPFVPHLPLLLFFGTRNAAALKLQVSVEASWKAAPLAAELLESFVEVGRGKEYLKALGTEANNFTGDAVAWRHAAAQVAEAQLCCGGKNSLFASFLSFRVRHFAASARVEAARGLEQTERRVLLEEGGTCEPGTPWVAFAAYGPPVRMACGAEALAGLTAHLSGEHPTTASNDRARLRRTPLDHVLYRKKTEKSSSGVHAIGYGDLADPAATAALLRALDGLAEALSSSKIAGYVAFRHGAPAPSMGLQGPTALAGYGVALLARSADEVTKSIDTEASSSAVSQTGAPDDGQCTWAAAQDVASKATVGDPAEFFHGLDLNLVAQRHPAVAPALCALREDLRTAVEEPAPPWQMKYLGVYAALRTAEVSTGPGGPSAGLAALEEMAQDFPSGWAHALTANTGGSEARVQELMRTAVNDLPSPGQVEVNGRKVQDAKLGTLQLLHTYAPLFNAVEQLGHEGFDQQRVAECLRDSRPAPALPDRYDTGDPRLEPRTPALVVDPIVLYDVRTDPIAESIRKKNRNEDGRMHDSNRFGPGTGSLVRFVGGVMRRGEEYPMQVDRALLGIGLSVDICEKDQLYIVNTILSPTPPIVLWARVTSSFAGSKEVVDLMRGALAAMSRSGTDGPQLARRLLTTWYSEKGGDELCKGDAVQKLHKIWSKIAPKGMNLEPLLEEGRRVEDTDAKPPADWDEEIDGKWVRPHKAAAAQPDGDIEDREYQLSFAFNADRPAALPAPSLTVNGRLLLDGMESFQKVCTEELHTMAKKLAMGGLDWMMTDEDFAREQYSQYRNSDSPPVDGVPPLLHVYHPALSGDTETYVPIPPDKLWGLPGGFVARKGEVPANAPVIAHTVVLADPGKKDARSLDQEPLLPAIQLVEAYAERLENIPSWRRWWLGIAVAGGCSVPSQPGCTAGSPLGLAGALRRCLMAAAPGRVSAEELKMNSQTGGTPGKAEKLQAALKSLTSALSKSSSAVLQNMASEGEVQASRILLDACAAAAKSGNGLWTGLQYLRPDELETTEADVEMWARHQEIDRKLGPVQLGTAMLSVNGRHYGPAYPVENGIAFAAAHIAFIEEIELVYLAPLGGPLGQQVDWRSGPGEGWPGSGVNRIFRQAGAQEDPLLMAYALAHRSKAVSDMSAKNDGKGGAGDSPEEEDGPNLEEAFNKAPSDLQLHLPCPEHAACPFRIFAVLDPLGEDAQRLPPIFRALREELGAELNLVLRPKELVEAPLLTYYRAAKAAPAPPGGLAALGNWDGVALGTEFALPPRRSLMLSVRLHTPETWLCSAVDSQGADLDALRAAEDRVVHARYSVEALFIEGWATLSKGPQSRTEVAAGRHLALTPLGGGWPEGAEAAGSDSVVVKSGYFQLRAPPGIYRVSSDVTTDTGITFDSLLKPSGPVELVELTGGGASLEVRVDMSGESKEEDAPGSKAAAEKEQYSYEGAGGDPRVCSQTIHIFSVASGHRYERLLRIMILSVREHTKCPLRLWLVDNFLSPNFRRLLPTIAKRVGFEVSRVTYKWPSWLRAQTQKQRIIWAYKILFLDVFFPIQVRRVLFIDADQIVRADVQELWKQDLKSHVYGFVPFCGSGPAQSSWFGSSGDVESLKNPDTVGFRFWEQGFWQNHLGNKHYHISALFVVDLVAFRQVGAGDILRDVYQSLTADPHSLANLDQDLPNYVQRMLPIFSLPQDWLWCESWCSEASKKRAKTIDMCQHPSRKEGKLQQARRIAPEWVDYDARLDAWIREANMTA